MLGPQVDEDTLEYMVEQIFGDDDVTQYILLGEHPRQFAQVDRADQIAARVRDEELGVIACQHALYHGVEIVGSLEDLGIAVDDVVYADALQDVVILFFVKIDSAQPQFHGVDRVAI